MKVATFFTIKTFVMYKENVLLNQTYLFVLRFFYFIISQGAKPLERPKIDFRRAHLVDGQDLFLWLVPSFSDKNPLTVLKKKLALFFFGC